MYPSALLAVTKEFTELAITAVTGRVATGSLMEIMCVWLVIGGVFYVGVKMNVFEISERESTISRSLLPPANKKSNSQ